MFFLIAYSLLLMVRCSCGCVDVIALYKPWMIWLSVDVQRAIMLCNYISERSLHVFRQTRNDCLDVLLGDHDAMALQISVCLPQNGEIV